MTGLAKHAGAVLGLILLGGGVMALAAPSSGELSPDERRSGAVAIAPAEGIGEARSPRLAEPARPGNPLWAIPLKDLVITRERPLFSPSRRPPPPAVTAAPPPPTVAVGPPPPGPPPQPPLALIGTVATLRGGFGVFLDRATNAVVRLKTGDEHEGWVLRSVTGRDVMLQRDHTTTVLTLPLREPEQTGAVGTIPVAAPAAGAVVVVPPPSAPLIPPPPSSAPRRPPPPPVEPYPDH